MLHFFAKQRLAYKIFYKFVAGHVSFIQKKKTLAHLMPVDGIAGPRANVFVRI